MFKAGGGVEVLKTCHIEKREILYKRPN